MSGDPATEAIMLFITAGDVAEAQQIGAALLEARLVACVNLITEVDSRFWWQGRIDQARETLLIAKTRASLFPRILETVRALHRYEVFEAIAVPICAGNPEYLRWIQESTRE